MIRCDECHEPAECRRDNDDGSIRYSCGSCCTHQPGEGCSHLRPEEHKTVTTHKVIGDWLEEHRARPLWRAEIDNGELEGFACMGAVIIVATYDHGWDVYTAAPTTEIKASLADLERRIGHPGADPHPAVAALVGALDRAMPCLETLAENNRAAQLVVRDLARAARDARGAA